MPFAELCAVSNFTFLAGAAHPEEYAREAAALGLEAIAIADANSVAGVVRAHQALKELAREGVAPIRESESVGPADVVARAAALGRRRAGNRDAHDDTAEDRAALSAAARGEPSASPKGSGWRGAGPAMRPGRDGPEPVEDGPTKPALAAFEDRPIRAIPRLIPAARLVLEDAQELVALPTDRAAWGRLTRLLTLGKRRAQKGECRLTEADVLAHAEGMILLWRAPLAPGADLRPLARWAKARPGAVHLLASPGYDGLDGPRLDRLAEAAEAAGAPMVASAAPLYHRAFRRRLADVLTCIREGTTIDALGRRAQPNAERRLRPEAELRRLFGPHAHAVDRAAGIARRCRFALDELRYEYPDEVADGEDPQARLERLTREGLAERYPDGVPDTVAKMAARELALIGKLDYAPYFLTVRDLVAFAESRGILCQGRGSAANSVVCYALRVTAIGPEIATMVFERFVSEARDEPPDIDVDFEHERREEVIQYIYRRYGRERAGLCATVIHYRARRAIREVGKAMGLSADVIDALASQIWGWSTDAIMEDRIREVGLDPADPRLALTLDLVNELIGFPRHLSQHVGGFVMTRGRLDELVPIENAAMEDRTVIEWDKDDIDALGILKVDVLSLGMLTCIRKAFELLERHAGQRWTLATLPPEDPAVYDMLCEADSLGVFQVESRAQMNFLPRMRPRCFYDLVIQVAIVRPGPIQGDMVHPYLRRRRGEEKVSFPSDALGEVLGKTLGVPLFQEQAMRIAIVGAGFDPSEADRLRRALATFRKSGTIHTFRERFVAGMLANGYDHDFAERCFSQIEGFGEYGFPESHAASFALLVYASAWLKRHHPAAFACALLNAQPMGFYAPAQIVRDARAHGVEVRPVCVNASYWDATLEPCPDSTSGFALRLGFRQIKAMGEEDGRWIAAARGNGYAAVEDLMRKAGLGPKPIRVLAEADAFAGLGLPRREALWEAKAIAGDAPLPLFAGTLEGEGIAEPRVTLPEPTEGEAVVEDYVALRLSLRAHPLALLRDRLTPPGA
ncbi:MAG TPA: error-prone DNA polymerase [Paracoccaceae bacterium]|nr:error-prone DNA polymerase [Paracoccaceae bacterium]